MTGAGPSSLGNAMAGPTPVVHGGPRPGAADDPGTDPSAAPSPTRRIRDAAVDVPMRLREHAAAEPSPGLTFSELLSPPAPASLGATAVVADDAGSGPDAAAPGHLLALLDGHWCAADTMPAMRPVAEAMAGAAGAAAGATSTSAAVEPPSIGHSAPDDGTGQATGPAVPAGTGEAAPARTGGAAVAGTVTFAVPPGDAPAPQKAAAMESSAPVSAAGDDAGNGFAIEGSPTVPATQAAPLVATRSAATALPPLPMPSHAASGFDDGFGNRITWMVEQRLGHAEIRLNPEHLGPIEVSVQLDGDVVRAGFHSANADVLQAIEATLPRLRDLLGQHGLQLGQAEVGQRHGGQYGAQGRSGSPSGSGDAGPDGAGQAAVRPTPVRPRGLVDMYA